MPFFIFSSFYSTILLPDLAIFSFAFSENLLAFI